MSKLPLSERLQASVRKPVELFAWSQKDKQPVADDSCLKYYYFPLTELDRKPGVNLLTGFDPNTYDPNSESKFIDELLWAVKQYEEIENKGQKIDAKIIAWRGLITKLLCLCQGNKDPKLVGEKLEYLVTGFDDQIFICDSPEQQQLQRQQTGSQQFLHKFMYSGQQFERAVMLNKPWGESTRDEIVNRYTAVPPPNAPKEEYCILVKNTIGGVSSALGAETDCVMDYKDPQNKLSRYVELKTTSTIHNPTHMANFERKLMKTWIQSFLSGVPKIAYGFRDRDFNLQTVEFFDTLKLPSYVSNSQALAPSERWNGKDITGFYAILVNWLKDKVENNKGYTLTFDPKVTMGLILKETTLDFGRQNAFLTDDFVAWRNKSSSNA